MALDIRMESRKLINPRRTVYSAVLYQDYTNVMQADGRTAKEARAELDKMITAAVANTKVGYVMCGDGKTTLVVRFGYGTWLYDIIDSERAHPCAVMLADGHTFRSALESAQSHAAGSYGGVIKVL